MDSPSDARDDSIDVAELLGRLRRSVGRTLGLACLGVAAGVVIGVVLAYKRPAVSTLRVNFGFSGFERGTYPNGSKFQAEDIRAPDIINEAIKRLGGAGAAPNLSSRIRGAIGVSGFVSPGIVKERDRLRATGQIPSPYYPDEYEISLSLPRDHTFSVRQRELLLTEIVNTYLEKFRRTYVDLPPEFGNAFDSLTNADFVEYELILTQEAQSLRSFLEQKIDEARRFRSSTNNLSFQDLLKEAELFSQIQLNDVLGVIYINGLSKDRVYALVKMEYYLRTLEDMEHRLKAEEAVVTKLLSQTQERAQNYVVATKAQVSPGTQPMMDQGFIDMLLANDAYNFLVRKALDAGMAVKRIEAERTKLTERRQRMESFVKSAAKDQAAAIAETKLALAGLESRYHALLAKVRVCLEDYSRQEYADAVRVTMQPHTSSVIADIMVAAIVGGGAGLFLGLGLGLLGLGLSRQP